MAFFGATTVQGEVLYAPALADTGKDLVIWKADTSPLVPVRVGYAYFFDLSDPIPANRYLILRGAVYMPGTVLTIPVSYTLEGKLCQVRVKWDVPGIELFIFY